MTLSKVCEPLMVHDQNNLCIDDESKDDHYDHEAVHPITQWKIADNALHSGVYNVGGRPVFLPEPCREP